MLLNEVYLGGGYFKSLYLKAFGLPPSTSISLGLFITHPNVTCGKNCHLGNTEFRAMGKITLGDNVSISYNNFITTTSHDFLDWNKIIVKPITIGDNVWITTNCTILQGVTIGSNTVIGAGSVVTHDIPSGVLAAGNPCKIIKKIDFSIENKKIILQS